MDSLQQQYLNFYCKQLKITTFKQLQDFIIKYKIKNNNHLLYKMCKIYNSDEYLKINDLY